MSIFKSGNDDVIDRLHYKVTTALLIISAALIGIKQHAGTPIQCVVPEVFSSSMAEYAASYCWSQNDYFLPFTTDDSVGPSHYKSRYSYYKWAPWFLICQAVCFSLPAMVWKLLAFRSGIKLNDMVRIASNAGSAQPDIRRNTVRILAGHLEAIIGSRRAKSGAGAWSGPIAYISCKIIYLINVIIWLIIVSVILVGKYGSTKFNLLPKFILCDFQLRSVGSNVQAFTLQCMMEICTLAENILVFLWIWFLVLAILTLISLIVWSIATTSHQISSAYIRGILGAKVVATAGQGNLATFERAYLSRSGIFIIRLLALNSCDLLVADLVRFLWYQYCEDMGMPPGGAMSNGSEKPVTNSEGYGK